MAKRNRNPDTAIEGDMTPMIDMVFQLIIFFIVVIDFTQKDLEDVDPPAVKYGAVADKPDPERLLINVTRNTSIVVKADTMFLPAPARKQLERTDKGRRKLANLARRLKDLEGMELTELDTPKRLVKKISRYALDLELRDKTEGLSPKDPESRIGFLSTAPTSAGAADPMKVVEIPLLIRADRYTGFYAINDVLMKCLPSADPKYSKRAPTERDPSFPFRTVEFSTRLDEEAPSRQDNQ